MYHYQFKRIEMPKLVSNDVYLFLAVQPSFYDILTVLLDLVM